MAEQRHPGDAGQHDRSRKEVRAGPGRMTQRHSQLQPADEQRYQHHNFGEVHHPAGDVEEIHLPQPDTELADQYAKAQVNQRGRNGQPA